jgi:hypothetical protein
LAGGETQSCCGRVISVKWGDYTRRIGIDGTPEAIKEAIRAAFRLRTKRAFWLEDEEQIIRSIDRDMPIGNYTLHLDEGQAQFILLANLCKFNGFTFNVLDHYCYLVPVWLHVGCTHAHVCGYEM